jgi:uncharacterized protein YjdB
LKAGKIEIVPGFEIICAGTKPQVRQKDGTWTGGSGSYTYEWRAREYVNGAWGENKLLNQPDETIITDKIYNTAQIWLKLTDDDESVTVYSDTVVVTTIPAPASPDVTDIIECYDGTGYPASAEAGQGETVVWYKALTGGTGTTTPPSRTETGSTTFFAVAMDETTTCESYPRKPVKVTINALPTVAEITGESSVCAGLTISLSNTTTGGTWSSSDESKATVTSKGEVTGIAAGDLLIRYSITNENNCTTTKEKSITVDALPTVAEITGDNAVCVNSTIFLSNTTLNGTWSSSDDDIATVSADGKVKGIAEGSAKITYEITNEKSCVASATKEITVNALPAVAGITGADAVCVGSQIKLENTTLGGKWASNNANIIIDETTGEVTGMSQGSAIITYTVQNENNCSTNAIKNIAINALPEVAGITGADAVCVGSKIKLENTTPGGTWSATGNATINEESGEVIGVSHGSATVKYTVTQNNCTAYAEYTITVNPRPLVTITGAGAVCAGATRDLDYTSTVGAQSVQWTSDAPEVATIDATSGAVTGIASGTAKISCTVTTAEGCTGNAEYTVTVYALPAAPTANDITVCHDGQMHTANATASAEAEIIWYAGATGTETASAPSRSEIGTTTAYAVARNAATGCESTSRTTVTVTVNRSAVAADIYLDGETAVCSGATTTLTAGSNIPGATFRWYNTPDAVSSIHEGNVFTAPALTASAIYYVSVKGSNVCENAVGERKPVTLTVKPAPKLIMPQNFAAATYSGALIDVNFGCTIDGAVIEWRRPYIDGIAQPASSGAGAIAETLNNISTLKIGVKYIVTMTSPDGCTAVDTITVTINPLLSQTKINRQPNDTVYCVCERDKCHKLLAGAEAENGVKYFYQWYKSSAPDIGDGVAVPGATDSIYYTQAGLPVGRYYYFCKITSDHNPTPVYSDIATITVEEDNADVGIFKINGEDITGSVAARGATSQYLLECQDNSIDITAGPVSRFAHISITVDGITYTENLENINIPLPSDSRVIATTVTINVITCDKDTIPRTLTVTKAVENFIIHRDDVLSLIRNSEMNGGYDDVRGVIWYRNGALYKKQAVDDTNVPASPDAEQSWYIAMPSGDSADDYSAEVNIDGNWHKVCGVARQGADINNRLIVYPNPVPIGENITIQLPKGWQNGKMNIYTLSGSTVKQGVRLPSNINIMNASDLFPGIYIMNITDDKGVRKSVNIIVE